MICKGMKFQLSLTAIKKFAYFTKDMTDYFLKATITFFFFFLKPIPNFSQISLFLTISFFLITELYFSYLGWKILAEQLVHTEAK